MSSAIAHTLFHFLWEGAAVAIALAFALFVCRPASARARYALACLAMLAMLAAFGATLAWFWPHAPSAASHATAPPAVTSPVFLRSEPPLATATVTRPIGWVAPLWMLGVMLFSLRSLTAWLAAMRLRRTAVAAASTAWQATLARLSERLRVSRPVMLLESYLTDIPVVIGFLKPVILVPAGLFTGFPPEHLEFILMHELAHIRRHDYLVNLLQSLAEDLLFYHPAMWWVSTVIRTEREHCCDDMVVAAQGDAHGFAEALTALAQQRWSAHDAALAANGGHLMNRIRRLLDPRRQPSRFIAAPVFSASLLVAAFTLVSITRAQPVPAPQAPAAPPVQAPSAPTPAPPGTQPVAAPPASAAVETPYQKWLNEDVYWIITPEERTAFERLTTDDQREAFIERFWLKRDPTPSTEENEYREEYYRRVLYANDNFSSSIPGWKTDRGMLYIKYGPPDEREEHPSGGSYQRPIEEGGGTTETHPFEKWRYRYLDAIGNNVTIEFVDTTGKGEYRMTTDPAEKDALLYVPGAGLTLYEQLGLARKSDRFSRTDGTNLGTGSMPLPASMDQFTRLEQLANLQQPQTPVVPPADAIEHIGFVGARRTPQDVLRALIGIHEGDKLDQDVLDKDVKLLRNTQRFDDVQVRYDRGQTGWIVTFTVVERPAQRPK